MSKQTYKWKRFWCPRSVNIDLRYGGGYLPDPESDWGRACNPDLVAFEAMATQPCLILLGEAGTGKTTAMEDAYKTVCEQTNGSEDVCFPFIKLGDYNSDRDLCQAIFGNPIFQEWIQGTHKLHLFLDSLDEGLLSIKILARILKREIQNLPCERLYFRITCRPAEWASSLEEELREKWGDEKVSVYKIAPLRQIDVVEALDQHGIPSDIFLQEVLARNAISFVIKPITLRLLIQIYKQEGTLPSSQIELYERGCLQLCEEMNPDRYEIGATGKLSVKKRMLIAGRIAAVVMFCNRTAVLNSRDYGTIPDADIRLQDLCIGKEKVDGQEFDVDESSIREVFSISGLFSEQESSHRTGFAHRTYAEFLAAWYLTVHNLPLEKIVSLILNSNNRVIPQLQETVKWLASEREDVFHYVMQTDPDVLLYSEIAMENDTNKKITISAILNAHDAEKLPYRYDIASLYKNFKHPTISEQLKPYLCGGEKNTIARMVAIDITQECHVKELQDDLALIALNEHVPNQLRLNASIAICNIGDAHVKAKLKPLAFCYPKNEPEEELKGCALMAVWPDVITIHELFSTLSQSVCHAMGGRYQRFIADGIGEHLNISDLPVALKWLKSQTDNIEGEGLIDDLHYPFSKLSGSILIKAWENLEEPEILKLFTDIALIRLKSWKQIISSGNTSQELDFNQMLQNNEKRHFLIESIIELIEDSQSQFYWLTRDEQRIVFGKDFSWIFEKLNQSENPSLKRKWVKLMRSVFQNDIPEQVTIVLENYKENSLLEEEFRDLIEAVAIEPPEWYIEDKKCQQERNKKSLVLDPPPQERILIALNQMDKDIYAWVSLCCEMTLKSNSTNYSNLFVKEITDLPGWAEAEAGVKQRILNAALRYLEQGQPNNAEWLVGNSFPYSVLAGDQALALLCQESPEKIASLSSEIWKKWTATILACPCFDNSNLSNDIRQNLLVQAYKNSAHEFRTVLSVLIDKDNREHGSIHINKIPKDCWDIELAQLILEKARNPQLTANSLSSLLDDLLIYGLAEAESFAKSLIAFPLLSDSQHREKTIVAARSLILYSEDAAWTVIWSMVQQDPELGCAVLESVSYAIKYESTLEQKIPESCIADLYIFLVQRYAEQPDDRVSTEAIEVDPLKAYIIQPEDEDSVKMWKDSIPHRLQERGTPEACEAIRKIIKALPELKEKLQWRLLDCEALARRNTWKPPTPEEFLHLILVQEPSNSDLLERMQRMDDQPKIDNSIKIGAHSNINGVVNTGGDARIKNPPSKPDEKGINWGNWLALISAVAAIVAIPVGIFNPEINQQIKQLFNHNPPTKIEQQSQPTGK